MDAHLALFLATHRDRLRPENRARVEDAAAALGSWFRRRGRAPATARAADLRGLLAAWYVRNESVAGTRGVRRFAAALRLFARWHTMSWPPGRARRLRRGLAAATQETLRAVRAGALLDAMPRAARAGASRDGFWQVALRGAEHVVLRELRSGDCIGPVGLPQRVVAALPAGAVLNLRLVENGGAWGVAAHGACYPALVTGELRAHAATAAASG